MTTVVNIRVAVKFLPVIQRSFLLIMYYKQICVNSITHVKY